MKTKFNNRLAFAILLLIAWHPGSAPGDEPKPQPSKWKVVSADNFERSGVGDEYVLKADAKPGWAVKDGVLVGHQVRSDHGAVIRRMLDFGDIEFECRFRFAAPGYSRFNLVFDDSKEKSVHSGHITRVSVSRTTITLSDDKTGGMSNEMRALRKLENRTAKQQEQMDRKIDETTKKVKVSLKDDHWHQLWVRIEGSRMSVKLDGKLLATLDSPGVDHPTRDKYGFTVAGKAIEFDELQVSLPKR